MKHLIKRSVLILAFIILFYYIFRNWPAIIHELRQFHAINLILALIMVVGSLLSKAILNMLLLQRFLHIRSNNISLLTSYAYAQIIKYIPGKIWSIMYQASQLSENIKKRDVWVINLYQLFLSVIFVILISLITFLYVADIAIGLKWVIMGMSIAFIIFFYLKKEFLLKLFHLDNEILKKYLIFFKGDVGFKTLIILVVDWLFYFAMWFCLCYPQLDFSGIYLLAVNYAVASALSLLIFFLPNGLVAREAFFIAISQYLKSGTSFLLVCGLTIRFLYTAGDLVVFCIIFVIERMNQRDGRSKTTLG